MLDQLQSVEHPMPKIPYLNMYVYGTSNTRKSLYCLNFIKNFHQLYPNEKIRKIIIISPKEHEMYKELNAEHYTELTPAMINDPSFFGDINEGVCILWLDDLSARMCKSKELEILTTTITRHWKIFLIFTSQSIFDNSSEWKSIQRNAHLIGITNSLRLRGSFEILMRQLFGKIGSKLAKEALTIISEEQRLRYNNDYYTILINCLPDCHDNHRIFYDIFSDAPMILAIK